MSYEKENVRYKRVKTFLTNPEFNGFTKNELFIMAFIKKGWGQDIAALSNMAEAMANLYFSDKRNRDEYCHLINQVLKRALHPSVNPYRKNFDKVRYLGKYGYYLEHLNIIIGAQKRISNSTEFDSLNDRISYHLIQNSLSYSNYHADLLPYATMKWSADQAAILYSLWLYDKNRNSYISAELKSKWIKYMDHNMKHSKTGLFKTEVLGSKKYSNQPRGCSLSYMIHYMARFSKDTASKQWKLYKKHMLKRFLGRLAFREFLEDYKGSWTPDSGPIIAGGGVAATGLGLNAASTMKDKNTYKGLLKTMNPFHTTLNGAEKLIGNSVLTRIGTDLLASAIWLNAETKRDWF